MRLSFADAGLEALDALSGVDAACLLVFEDQRPLKGVAGYIDWRLCGGLSRILADGRFRGDLGDALLFPVGGGLRISRVFCFGAGKRQALSAAGYGTLARKACEAMSLAGVKSFVTELPATGSMELEAEARVFIAEGATRFKGERIVLLGDGRALARAFGTVAGSMKGLQVDCEPLGASVNVVAPPKAAAPKVARK